MPFGTIQSLFKLWDFQKGVMARITVDIEVLNAAELIRNRKGKFFHWVATKFRSKQDLTKVIEKRISEELVSALRENLDLKLKEEGIAANLKISVRN